MSPLTISLIIAWAVLGVAAGAVHAHALVIEDERPWSSAALAGLVVAVLLPLVLAVAVVAIAVMIVVVEFRERARGWRKP